MKTFASSILILLIQLVAVDASAILTPNVKVAPILSTSSSMHHKRTLKEKAAWWILRRKIKKQLKKHKITSDTTKCDQILLKTGDRIDVNLIKISEQSVRFTRCHEDSDAALVLSKEDIQKIFLSDGIVVYKNTNKPPKKSKSSGDAGKVILIVLGIILGGLLGAYLLLWAFFNSLFGD